MKVRCVRIAFAGKGGAGKSTIAGTAARLLARRGHRVVALDADHVPGLAMSLGLGAVQSTGLAAAAERSEEGRWRLVKGVGAARAISRYGVDAPDGVRLVQFDKADAAGLEPLIPSLSAFFYSTMRLARDPVLTRRSIVGDCAAGTASVAFKWIAFAREVIVIAEPTSQSLLTARRIAAIARSREGTSVTFVANKITSPHDLRLVEEKLDSHVLVGIPLDPAVAQADRLGIALLDHAPSCSTVVAIKQLIDRLEARDIASKKARVTA